MRAELDDSEIIVRLRHFARLLPALLTLACDSKQDTPRSIIGYAQVSSIATLDESRAGFFQALADSGFIRDSTITVIERNAQGDIPTLSLIMSEFLQKKVTHVATISSVATQAALKAGLRNDGKGMLLPISRGIARAEKPGNAATVAKFPVGAWPSMSGVPAISSRRCSRRVSITRPSSGRGRPGPRCRSASSVRHPCADRLQKS